MRLEKYLVNEADTSSATSMELSIVQAINGEKITKEENSFIARSVAEALKRKVTGKAEHFGKGGAPLSNEWLSVGGGRNNTPKTDIYVGKKNISVKKDGGSQLMSASKSEATGVFAMATQNYLGAGNEKPLVDEVLAIFDDMSGYIRTKNTKTDISKGNIEGDSEEVLKAIEKYENRVHQRIESKLKDLFDNEEFKRYVVFEAATGKGKFGGNIGTATDLLVFNDTGLKYFEDISSVDSPAIMKLSNGTSVRIAWKALPMDKRTGFRTLYSSVRLQVKEEMSKYSSSDLLNEGIISNVINKVRNFFIQAWNKVKNWVFESVKNFMEFFGIQVNSMSVTAKL